MEEDREAREEEGEVGEPRDVEEVGRGRAGGGVERGREGDVEGDCGRPDLGCQGAGHGWGCGVGGGRGRCDGVDGGCLEARLGFGEAEMWGFWV